MLAAHNTPPKIIVAPHKQSPKIRGVRLRSKIHPRSFCIVIAHLRHAPGHAQLATANAKTNMPISKMMPNGGAGHVAIPVAIIIAAVPIYVRNAVPEAISAATSESMDDTPKKPKPCVLSTITSREISYGISNPFRCG